MGEHGLVEAFQPFHEPITLTLRAFGAHTRNTTPALPSRETG